MPGNLLGAIDFIEWMEAAPLQFCGAEAAYNFRDFLLRRGIQRGVKRGDKFFFCLKGHDICHCGQLFYERREAKVSRVLGVVLHTYAKKSCLICYLGITVLQTYAK
ncbi:hypothetical protein [Ruegeria atlantica]|uniref:hypothetical protein n=1 Tax=Ruegeria atlantica TaxID=81569 RepID=UPI00349FD3E7